MILTNRIVPKGPPVSIAMTLNDALCQNIHLQCVYFEEWKKRLAMIEERFLHPQKEAPLINETIIVATPGKSVVKNILSSCRLTFYNLLGIFWFGFI